MDAFLTASRSIPTIRTSMRCNPFDGRISLLRPRPEYIDPLHYKNLMYWDRRRIEYFGIVMIYWNATMRNFGNIWLRGEFYELAYNFVSRIISPRDCSCVQKYTFTTLCLIGSKDSAFYPSRRDHWMRHGGKSSVAHWPNIIIIRVYVVRMNLKTWD